MSNTLEIAIAKHGITVKSEFVPFSKSRNSNFKDDRGNPVYSLNWKVTLQHNGRDVLTTDYSAGIAHCPGYKAKVPASWSRPVRFWIAAITEWECENGFHAEWKHWDDFKAKLFPFTRESGEPGFKRKAIEPEAASVIYSLILDSNVINYATFEEWAENFGYDPDSRKGETIYRACLEIALRLRAALGESILAELNEAASDY